MPYKVGAKGSYGCSGFPAVKDDGTVMGCHTTRGAAARQIYAINISEGKIGKAMVKEGDMVMAPNDDEVYIGRVVHFMTEGLLGYPESEYSIEASPEEPAVLVQLFEMEEGTIEETKYFVGFKASEVMAMPALESNIEMDKALEEVKNLTAVIKQMVVEVPGGTPQEQTVTPSTEYKGCGCETCKAMGVDCPDCPACSPDIIGDGKDAEFEATKPETVDAYDNSMGKREFTAEQRRQEAATGDAMPDGSFPISSRSDLMNAIRSVGRAKNYDAAKKHIIRRARALNATDMLPEDWKNSVKKTMWGGTVFDLNPFVN